MPYIPEPLQKRLVDVDTKVNLRATVTTVFLGVMIVAAAAAVIGMIATAVSYLLQPGA